jgi:amino acid transporter
MFSYSRDEALPGSSWLRQVHSRFGTPVNALVTGAIVSALFVLLVFVSPASDKHILFITYPGGLNALYALVSFGVSGIYLSFLLTVIAAFIARSRGWVPEGRFTLGSRGTLITVIAMVYLALMLINVVLPTGLTSPRAVFNYDWITLLVIAIIAAIGAAYFFTARPDRGVRHHLHDDLEPTGAERDQQPPQEPPAPEPPGAPA